MKILKALILVTQVKLRSIESSSESTDSGDDDIGNARDWCEITASGRSGPPRFPFTGTPGVTFPVNINYTPLDILEMFLDSNLMDIIVKETNNYAEQERKANRAKISRCSRSKKWIPTNDREMKLFFGLIILQGIVRKPNQAMFWSHQRILHIPVYSKVMPVNRFILLFRYLHFCNNEAEKKDDFPNPKLWKLCNVIENLRKKFCNF
ncbi:piggyBac transposable element-derived protein 4 [Trichonephila clavata]|uniref:PiggyBac transposable element-derived protein 4 n=1 Tax=Trichonephila clavata TaxID=2740835 RepID=A0A8X6JPN5_TRICU|nr:piggyBac transposable element-derived protein 4 [Trichonephila clavata]